MSKTSCGVVARGAPLEEDLGRSVMIVGEGEKIVLGVAVRTGEHALGSSSVARQRREPYES